MQENFGREGGGPPSARLSRRRRLRSLLSEHSVAGQVFLLQLALALVLVVAAVVVLVLQARGAGMEEARQRSVVGAQAFAHAPGTLDAVQSSDPTTRLQPRAEEARKEADLDYIVVFDPKTGLRWTHPDPSLIGERVIGSYRQGLAGKTSTSTFATSVGPAVNTTVPVKDRDGKVAGLVSVGITVRNTQERVGHQLPLLLGSAAGALALATGGAALVSRRLRRQTHGLDPAEITRMFDHHDAVLHAVREGVLIVGGDGRLLLANDEARRLLHLPADAERRPVQELGLQPRLLALLTSGTEATDEVLPSGDRLLAVNVRPTAPYGGPAGTAVTLRDSTELRVLAGRAEEAQERLRLLYDAGMRIGTTLDVVRTAEELAEVTVPRFADIVTVELKEAVLRGQGPTGADQEAHRVVVRGLAEDSPLYPPGELLGFLPGTAMASEVARGRPVPESDLRTADRWRSQDPERARAALEHGIHSLISVPLQAGGVVLGLATFWRSGASDRFDEEDLVFAEELAARAAVSIDNARRYTREHTTAVTLQRSLLPRVLPEQSALEVAHRYLPAQAGVGGDWFDLIPLPGARVALVVGDVVGHGLHAAATMGRLRTAVHNFSALDLPPEELLGYLDELVSRIDTDRAGEDNGAGQSGERAGITGASCLYAIYDPVDGRATLAGRAIPAPALVLPDGTVTFPDVPVAPPLGLGGSLPVETAEIPLPEGSRLVLYTDGLVEGRRPRLRHRPRTAALRPEGWGGPHSGGSVRGRPQHHAAPPARAMTSRCWWPGPACWIRRGSPSGTYRPTRPRSRGCARRAAGGWSRGGWRTSGSPPS